LNVFVKFFPLISPQTRAQKPTPKPTTAQVPSPAPTPFPTPPPTPLNIVTAPPTPPPTPHADPCSTFSARQLCCATDDECVWCSGACVLRRNCVASQGHVNQCANVVTSASSSNGATSQPPPTPPTVSSPATTTTATHTTITTANPLNTAIGVPLQRIKLSTHATDNNNDVPLGTTYAIVALLIAVTLLAAIAAIVCVVLWRRDKRLLDG
jgi:hypothetical protein